VKVKYNNYDMHGDKIKIKDASSYLNPMLNGLLICHTHTHKHTHL
jgi:hypothetical protein